MKYILPVVYPTITSYPGRADFYAIAEGNTDIYPWLMERYIQTESFLDRDSVSCDIDFFLIPQVRYSSNTALEAQNAFCPYIENCSLYSNIVGTDNRIVDFIKEAIFKGYYVIVDINGGCISAYESNKPYLHNMMVYGFDDDKEYFNIADFMKGGRYTFSYCSFSELKNAVESFDYFDKRICPDKGKTSLIRIKQNFQHEFQVINLKRELGEYLNITDNYRHIFVDTNCFNIQENNCRSFGNLHFNNLAKYLMYCSEMKHVVNNIRAFHVFYDHKKSIFQRINYLVLHLPDCEYLQQEYKSIVNEALNIRNVYLKSILKKSIDNFERIADRIYSLKGKEEKILLALYSRL